MAQDATGTPSTVFSLPKYNVNVDPPSGRGFNAFVDDLDSKLNTKFPHTSGSGLAVDEVPVYNGTTWVYQKVTPTNMDLSTNVATTVAGLGTGASGRQGMLRIGATPFDFIPLTYDATLAKWVSPVFSTTWEQPASGVTTASTTYTGATIGRHYIPNHAAIHTAGLRPEAHLTVYVQNTGANTTSFRVATYSYDHDDTSSSVPEMLTADPTLSSTQAAGIFKATSTFVAFTGTPTQTHSLALVEWKVSAGTGTLVLVGLALRWVSA